MRVLHYIELYPVKSETFIKNLITQVGLLGVENSLILHYVTEDIDDSQVNYQQLAYHRTITHIIRNRILGYRNINNPALLKKIKKEKPDLIHAHFGPNGIRIHKYLRKNNISIPLVISAHGTDLIHIQKNKILKSEFSKILKDENTTLIVPSKFLLEHTIFIGGDLGRIHIIPSAVSRIFEQNSVKRSPKEFRITNIGRFIPLKGQLNLIQAFYEVSKAHPNTKLTVVGYGNLENELRANVMHFGITDNVEIICGASHEKIRELLNQTDLYVQPSILGESGEKESLGLSVIEAQMSGCPCVVSEIGGLPETIVNGSTGTTVTPGSVNELKSAIIRYIEDTSLWDQHSVNAKIYAREKFSESKVYQQVINLYTDIVNSPK